MRKYLSLVFVYSNDNMFSSYICYGKGCENELDFTKEVLTFN
jgi:hypothetical protein